MRLPSRKTVKRVLLALVILLVIAVLHYNLPQHDIVRITDTYEKRIDPGGNSFFWAAPDAGNDPNVTNRDVFFIQAVRPDGRVIVYRNEDTGWGWPPYFKFDTANLQAEAADMKSTADNPKWVVITHYGWRNQFFSIYPNAIAIRPASGPDERIIPWASIIILAMLAFILFMIRRMWLQFRERTIEPALESMEEMVDRVDAEADAAAARARGLWGRLRARLGVKDSGKDGRKDGGKGGKTG